jgi:hypothetical protein
MKFKALVYGLGFFLSCVLVTSCHKGDVVDNSDNLLTEKAKAWFDKNSKLYPAIWDNNRNNLSWSEAFSIKGADNSNYLIVPYKNLVRFQTKSIVLSRQLIFKLDMKDEVEKAQIMEVFADEKYLSSHKKDLFRMYNSNNYELFTGGIIYYNFDYSVIDNPNYRSGRRIGYSKVKLQNSILPVKQGNGLKNGIASVTNECLYYFFGIFYDDGSFQPLYYVGCVCDVEEGGNVNWANYNGSNNGNPGGSEGPTTEQILAAFDASIVDSLSIQCVKTILANLKSANSGGKIGQMLNLLSQNIPSWNWVVSDGETVTGHSADTYTNGPNGCFTILSRTKMQNCTELAIVRTMLHEAVHSYLVNYFYNDPSAAGADYPQLLQMLANSTDTAQIHHIVMGNQIVSAIAASLKLYGQSHGYELDDEVYNDMAWGGLYGDSGGVPAFNQLTPFVRERIRARNAAENSSSPCDGETPSSPTPGCSWY